MATDYVSAVTINGTQVTSRGGTLNLASGGGVQFSFDSSSQSVYAIIPPAPVALDDGGLVRAKSEIAERILTPTISAQTIRLRLKSHVNNHGDTTTAGNGRVMRYEPMPSSPNVIGGYRRNVVSTTNGGSVIAGGGSSIYPNMINGDFSVVGGGAGNLAINGGTIAGGARDTAGEEAFVGGGAEDSAGYLAVVSGGFMNKAHTYAAVGGGTENKALGAEATVAGGATNSANGLYDAISGGTQNSAYDSASVIAGGVNNSAYSQGAVGGGFENSADTFSAIPGGYRLQLSRNSFGFNAGSRTIPGETSVGDSNVAFFGNTNLWITNADSVPRQLRLYGPNADFDYGDLSQAYTSFQYNGGTTIHYKLPPSQGISNTVLTNDGTGQLSWGPGVGSGDWTITGNSGTSTPPNFLGTIDSNSLELHIFNSGSSSYGAGRIMRYEVNDTSANILGGFHDNAVIGTHLVGVTIAGGGAKNYADTAKGSYAVISGGRDNMDTNYAFVGGGDSNRAMGAYSVIVGGTHNLNEGDSAAIVGGTGNIILNTSPFDTIIRGGKNCFVGAGSGNVIARPGIDSDDDPTFSSAIVAGTNNSVSEGNSIIGAGLDNRIEDDEAFIGAGLEDTITHGVDAAIVAGTQNWIGANLSFIGAGENIETPEVKRFIGGGEQNTTSGNLSFVRSGGSKTTLLRMESKPVFSRDRV